MYNMPADLSSRLEFWQKNLNAAGDTNAHTLCHRKAVGYAMHHNVYFGTLSLSPVFLQRIITSSLGDVPLLPATLQHFPDGFCLRCCLFLQPLLTAHIVVVVVLLLLLFFISLVANFCDLVLPRILF